MKSMDADFKKLELIHSAIKRIDNIDFDSEEQDTIEQTMLCIKEVSTGDFSVEMRKEFTGLVRKGLLEIYNKMMNQLNGEIIPPTPTTFRPGLDPYNVATYPTKRGGNNIINTPVILGSSDDHENLAKSFEHCPLNEKSVDKGIKGPINTTKTT